MFGLMRQRAQTMIEYTAVIACLVAALLAMRFYVQRAMQGRLREAADQIGDQYGPGETESDITTVLTRDVYTETKRDDFPNTIIDGKPGYATWQWEVTNTDESIRFGTEVVGP